ncbi:hypothetical protein MJO28_000744 [Puccinia striiformis f. sp. tritici]|uniref:Uncharacterized protein n=4 Tax=Puccinia striiformis TaxID=27350 RepID=A0A0L0V2L4_9BASI|nr:hypothetical protein Pst134EA_000493 [Puccinia striiformis f. sp. tritici]XP_047812875.1 hypothetical protein Pst134EA_000493 [Puccinia striiformis f. sp. tritici]XP_047812876.1 hypothetical protein Pst134EA_000493 [Puccinia striiformis f. sp. tritici]KAI9601282.1 hypothetical protein H4Q26_001096 [Puccinia striiformis f. sp. tritici PST-130]KNE93426.1 hypothetical protein PSTG_13248 [Puccinia striiformis f. sp. tritici PST-78]POW07596.1 hypothetical protein PSTT_08168 [Puccinia striiformis
MFTSRLLLSSVLCVIAAVVTATTPAPLGPLNLCSDKDSVYKVTGVLQLNGTVSRVDGQGHPTGNPDGICECQPTGINCNTRPSAPIFDGPPVFCANPITNKCDAPAPQKLCSPAGSKYQVVGVIHPDGSVSSVDAKGTVSPRASGICTCTPNGVPKCHLAPTNTVFSPLVFCANRQTNKC